MSAENSTVEVWLTRDEIRPGNPLICGDVHMWPIEKKPELLDVDGIGERRWVRPERDHWGDHLSWNEFPSLAAGECVRAELCIGANRSGRMEGATE